MAKAIYSLVIYIYIYIYIYIFREQFRFSVKEETAFRSICIFIIRCYIKAWFDSLSAIQAPFQDLNFIKNLLNHTSIDQDISQISVKKYCGHLWYLSAELCEFTFFDEVVLADRRFV
jgi:hypothetical protein